MKSTMHRLALASAVGLALTSAAHAQTYPVKPVRMINPFSPGGSLDLVARILSKTMSTELGQTVVVENRPGADGTIGVDHVAKSAPDGYTLLIVQSSITINPSLKSKVPYDPVRDFAPISKVASYMFFLVTHPSVPVRTVKDLIALAKAKPGQLNYGSVGMGSGTHLSGALFEYMAGVKMTHIPYKGTGQVLPALLGGQVELHFGSTSVVPYVKDRKLAALGVSGTARSAALPDTPTIAESGVPGYEMTAWNALFAPVGTPPAIVNRLNALAKQAMELPESRSVLDAQGLELSLSTPAELGGLVKTELGKWAKVIKAAGIRAE
jgi:tripartite-type tricarboxylate transporter receptor subunit TctC